MRFFATNKINKRWVKIVKKRRSSGIRKYILYLALVSVISCAVAVPVLTMQKYKNNSMAFIDDGYMLLAADQSSDSNSINQQCYFNGGDSYRIAYGKTVVFNDANGNKVSAEPENFLHYNNGSMNGLSQSVIFDTDNVQPGDQLSYYSISSESILRKAGDGYSVNNNGGSPLEISNFLWKITNDRYMVVSKNIDLVVSENSEQSFEDYVELRYIDEGIAHIVTHNGTYSTISSDAYLLLNNGIRIYIGSKNVSDGENIIMNMTSMVVDSDENIDVIPDEDYTIEQNKQPQIVVNANDGESGKAGESGELGEGGEAGENGTNGQNGANGRPGELGPDGDRGVTGENAPNSGVIYEQKPTPIFNPVELSTTMYGVKANITYNSNKCTVNNAWISIVEKNSGVQVWKKDIKESLNDTEPLLIECNTLVQDTDYIFSIYAEYKSNDDTEFVTQALHQQAFRTDSIGVKIKSKYATTNSVYIDLTRSSSSLVKRVQVKLYDEDLNNIVSYAELVEDNEVYGYNSVNNSFDVSSVGDGNKIPLVFKNLPGNTTFYAQIQITELVSESAVSIVPTTFSARESQQLNIPASSFIMLKCMTLKQDPAMSAPSVSVSLSTNSFVVSPGQIQDNDKGAIGYRYELKDVNGKLVFSQEMEKASSINVKFDSINDFRSDAFYNAQIVMLFNNNESVIEFRSPVSDSFTSGSGIWPTVTANFPNDNFITPTSIEGEIVIDDKDGTLKVGPNSTTTIQLKYSANGSSSEGIIKTVCLDTANTTDFEYNEDAKLITIPFKKSGLKANQHYTIFVTASELTAPGSMQKYTNATVGTVSFKTKEYNPLYVSGKVNERGNDELFNISVYFAPSNYSFEENLSNFQSSIWGNLSAISAKSITVVKFEAYDSMVDGSMEVPNINRKLATYQVKASEFEGKDAAYIVDNYSHVNGSCLYGKMYINTSDLDNHLNTQTIDTSNSITISSKNFKDSAGNEAIVNGSQERNIFIKVTAYDYTYGIGIDSLYGDQEVKIGSSDSYNASVTDQWIRVSLGKKVPDLINLTEENNIELLSVNKANEYINSGVYGTSTTNVNVPSDKWEEVRNKWTGLKESTTGVAVKFTGPNSYSEYFETVNYWFYKVDVDESGNETETLIKQAELLRPQNGQMPSYTLYLDYGTPSLKRGDLIRIKMQGELKDYPGLKYPAQFYDGVMEYLTLNLRVNKQKPEIDFLAYEGTIGNNPDDTIAYMLNDPDSAFERAADGNINFYVKGNDTPIVSTSSEILDGTFNRIDLPVAQNNVYAYLKYSVDNQNYNNTIGLLREDNMFERSSEVKLLEEVDDYRFKASLVQDKIVVYVPFKVGNGSSPDITNAILGFNLKFSVESGSGVKTFEKNTIMPNSISAITVDDNGDTVYYGYAELKIDSSELYGIIKGGEQVKIEASAYYDNGKYGYNYLRKNVGNGNYYAMEVAGHEDNDSQVDCYAYINNSFLIKKNNEGIVFNTDEKTLTKGSSVFTYSNNGLKYEGDTRNFIIKDVSLSTYTDDINQTISIPKYLKLEVAPGLTTATISLKSQGEHNYSRIKLYVGTKDGNGDISWISDPKIDESVLSDSININQSITGLDGNKEYYVKVVGVSNGIEKQINTVMKGTVDLDSFHKFKTLIEYNHEKEDVDTVRIIPYDASYNKDNKSFVYKLNIKNIALDDFKNSISKVKVEILDSQNNPIPSALTEFTSNELENSFKKHSGSEVMGNIERDIYFDWNPSGEYHRMGENDGSPTSYNVKVTYEYSNGQTTESVNNYQIYSWPQEEAAITVTPSTSDRQIALRLSGYDTNRIYVKNNEGYVPFKLDVFEINGSTESFVKSMKLKAKIDSYDMLTFCNDDGTPLGGNRVRIYNLDNGSQYKIVISSIMDYKNIDLTAASDPNHTVIVGPITVALNDSISADKLDINGDMRHTITGNRLEECKKIIYAFRKSGGSYTNVTIESDINSYLSGSNGIYFLNISNLMNPTTNTPISDTVKEAYDANKLTVNIYFYKNVNDQLPTTSVSFISTGQEEGNN